MNKIVKKGIFAAIAAVLVAVPIVGNHFYAQYETMIKGLLVPPIVISQGGDTVEKASGDTLSQKAVTDGIVMLKNKDGALPLDLNWDMSVNLLGYASVNWLYGGSGSGRVVKNPADSNMASLIDALKGFDIEVNEDILNYYRSIKNPAARPDIDTLGFNRDANPHKFDLYDPKIEGNEEYKKLLDDAKTFADTAIVVIGRQGGESEDMPEIQYKNGNQEDTSRHSLELSTEEEELIRYSVANYEKTVVIINSTNAFQMDFLDRIEGIDAALLVGPTGTQGAMAIPYILYGQDADGKKVSPSGKTADILPYDFTKNVAYNYCGYEGVSFFSNTAEYGTNQTTNAGVTKRPSLPYVDYIEGIYVGYRYYETADKMGLFQNETFQTITGEMREGYDAVVQFPFGYGLSYTDFKWTVTGISKANGSALAGNEDIAITVIVENTGAYPGKDVVELYAETPYIAGGIEKSAAKLVDFEKTELLEPGKTQTLTLHAKARDLASYDCYDKNGNGKTTYELDPGNYSLRLATDSHHVKNVDFVTSSAIDGPNKEGKIDYHVDTTIVLENDPYTGKTIDNLFTGEKAVDGRAVDGLDVDGWDIPYISRQNLPTSPVAQNSTHDNSTGRAMDDETRALVTFAGGNGADQTKANAWNDADEDEFGNPIDLDDSFAWGQGGNERLYESDGVTLTERGEYFAEHFDDEDAWNDLLGQISYAEATGFVSGAHPNTKALNAIGYPATTSLDGPSQIGSFNAANSQTGVGFPCAAVLAQTWNKNLMFEIGLEMGAQMNEHGEHGVYGCGMNIHRNPFGGRNYEYFSEDPYLTGAYAANYARGVKLNGKIAILKHFAAAETETSRDSLYTYMSEQALREIYLEPFRMAVEGEGLSESAAQYKETENGYEPLLNSLMTSYNRVGAVWAGGSAAMMKGVLANEWGFRGEIITDWADNDQYMHLDQTIRVGGTLGMDVNLRFNYDNSLRARYALRDAVKNTVYAKLRASRALADYNTHPYEGRAIVSNITIPGNDWVTPVVYVIYGICGLGALAALYFGVLGHPGIKFKKKER